MNAYLPLASNISTAVIAAIGMLKIIQAALLRSASFRSRWFLERNLSDLKVSQENSSESYHAAIKTIRDARVFRYLFGFYGNPTLRSKILGALQSGLLNEQEVRVASTMLTVDDKGELRLKEWVSWKVDLIVNLGFATILIASILLILITALIYTRLLTTPNIAMGIAMVFFGMFGISKLVRDATNALTQRNVQRRLEAQTNEKTHLKLGRLSNNEGAGPSK